MFGLKPKRPQPDKGKKGKKAQRTPAGWEKERDRSARTQAKKSRVGRDIAPDFPAVVNPKRKAAARESLALFCRTYFPETFSLEWSEDHLRAIDRLEKAARGGGLFAFAFPRGSGKTTLAEAATMWVVCYGFRQFIVVIGSDKGSALEILESVKSEFECNDLLLADFPEICHPVRKLEGVAQRANAQHYQGRRTHMVWSEQELVLPCIPGSVSSSAVIRVTGITGRIRGMKFKRPDGRACRPDMVLVDDPQTDESANSPSQCVRRIRTLCGAVLGLAGPGKKIAGMMPCTVIRKGDMADEILDRQRHPEWQGERTKLVYEWPTAEALWDQYKKIRADGLRAGDDGKAATEFYRQHQAVMDGGSRVAWPARKNADELSALQHAMNLRADLGDAAFFAEYQNDPQDETTAAADALTAELIGSKINRRARGEIPLEAHKLVAFIDVQKPVLFWMVAAFEEDFTGYIVDYNVFPEQREWFTKREVKATLALLLKTRSLEETIYQGLSRLTGDLLNRKFSRDDGSEVSIDRCLIDANWGDSTDVVKKFCRESPHAGLLVPSHGKYFGAKTTNTIDDYKKKPGDEIGDHWRRPAAVGRKIRHVLFDTNYWKTFFAERIRTAAGGPGCLSLFGDDAEHHKLLIDHWLAEDAVPVTAKGRTVTEWMEKVTRPDNDWLDCAVGCFVAGSMLKVSLAERKQRTRKRKKRVKLSEIKGRTL